jgi:hypothetical protein
LKTVNLLNNEYGKIPSFNVLRQHENKAYSLAKKYIVDQLCYQFETIPPFFGVMTDNNNDIHGNCRIVNTIIQHPTLGEILIGSTTISDDRQMTAQENAKIVRNALIDHQLAPVLNTNIQHKQLRDAPEHPHPGGCHLDYQCLSSVTTDNCNTALVTAHRIIEESKNRY